MSELSYSSDFEGMEDAYLGEGGVNFSAESSDEDLENMFADLAAAQDGSEADSDASEGGAKRRRKRAKSPAKSKSKAKAKRRAKSKSPSKTKKTAKKRVSKKKTGGDSESEAAPKKAAKKTAKKAAKKPAKKPVKKNDSEFIHYTMVTDSGKEVGDYRVRRGKQGPSAAAAKAATRHINDHKLKNKDSGSFDVKIRQTTRGSGYNKVFTYKVTFKKEKASDAFKKMTGRAHVIKKKLTAA